MLTMVQIAKSHGVTAMTLSRESFERLVDDMELPRTSTPWEYVNCKGVKVSAEGL